MNKKSLRLMIFAVGVQVGMLSGASAAETDSLDVAADVMEAVYANQRLAKKNAPIHSQELLASYLQISMRKGNSPLDLLSNDSKQRFIRSLRFNESGVTSFYYADIERELSLSDAYKLLSLFGAQHVVGNFSNPNVSSDSDYEIRETLKASPLMLPPEDHMQYWCSSAHTCSSMAGSICMSGC